MCKLRLVGRFGAILVMCKRRRLPSIAAVVKAGQVAFPYTPVRPSSAAYSVEFSPDLVGHWVPLPIRPAPVLFTNKPHLHLCLTLYGSLYRREA
jgi:hypothetical protein